MKSSYTSSPGRGSSRSRSEDDAPSFAVGKHTLTQDLGGGARPAGAPLAAPVRNQLEPSFGTDLSSVRVGESPHVDAMGARAYAQGNQAWFAPGEYKPDSSQGMFLIAHEIAHMVQQSVGRAPPSGQAYGAVNSDPSLEQDADAMAARAVRGEPALPGANPAALRPLSPPAAAPTQLKLKVGATWHDHIPRANLAKLERWGFGAEVIEVLQAWAADDERTADRVFGTWRAAAEAAARRPANGHDDDDDEDADGADGADGDGDGLSWTQCMILLFVVMILFMPMLAPLLAQMAHPNYQVQSDLSTTAHTARRPLEPLLPLARQAQNGTLGVEDIAAQLAQATGTPAAAVPLLLQQVPAPVRTLAEQNVGQVGAGVIPHAFSNPCNTGVFHEHIFMPGGANVGSFDDGIRADRPDMMPHYDPSTARHYEASTMQSAAGAASQRHQPYRGLTDNCQDFVSDSVSTYHQMGGREIVPSQSDAFLLTLCDVLTGSSMGQRYLDAQVDAALTERLSGSQSAAAATPTVVTPVVSAPTSSTDITLAQSRAPAAGPAAGPAAQPTVPDSPEAVAALLGMSPDALQTTINQIMSRTVDIPEQGATRIRDMVCTPKGPNCPSVLEGAVNELVLRFAEQDIVSNLPSIIVNNARARARMVGDLAQRITRNLMGRLRLHQWVCQAPPPSAPSASASATGPAGPATPATPATPAPTGPAAPATATVINPVAQAATHGTRTDGPASGAPA